MLTSSSAVLTLRVSSRAGRDVRDPEVPVRPRSLATTSAELPRRRLTLVINLLVALPAATRSCATFPGKRLLFSARTLPLYVPPARHRHLACPVYNFTYHLTTSLFGAVFAMVVGRFRGMLTPSVVASSTCDCRGGRRASVRTAGRPSCGSCFALWPGVIGGLMLSFIIGLQRSGDALRPPAGHHERATPRVQPRSDLRLAPTTGGPLRKAAHLVSAHLCSSVFGRATSRGLT